MFPAMPAALLILLLSLPPDDPSLGHQNQYPLYVPWMTVPARRVDSAAPLALRMTQRYTAMHYFAKGGGWEYRHDLEQSQWLLEAAFNTRYGQILISQAAVYRYGGVMDPFLNAYHKALRLPNYGRELRDPNLYEFTLTDGDGWVMAPRKEVWLPSEPVVTWFHPGVLNLSFSAKVPLYGKEASVRSGTVDVGVNARHVARLDADWSAAFAMGYIHREKTDRMPGRHVRGTPHASVAVGRTVGAWLWAAEVATHPPLFRGMDFPRLEKSTIELVMGARMPTRVGILAITFSEDLSITAPDFTIGVAWTPSRP
jgi:hypothetical protein